MRARDALGVPRGGPGGQPGAGRPTSSTRPSTTGCSAGLAAAADAGIVGHDATPFLLDHIQRATEGRSLDVNVAVYDNNVAVAGAIARALAR